MKLKNSHGLFFEFLENGSLRCIEADPVRISMKAGTLFSGSGSNLYLRKKSVPDQRYEPRGKHRTQTPKQAEGNLPGEIKYIPLLGPESNSRFTESGEGFVAAGEWEGIDYACFLQLSEKSLSWKWRIEITNGPDESPELDLIYVQDAGLKPITDGLINEYYVSQYLERLILEDKEHGSVICCRQNMKEAGGYPWLMLACGDKAVAAGTDGMQFYGPTFRGTGIPEGLLAGRLGGECAGESSVLSLQEKAFTLEAGEVHSCVFIGSYLHDHPAATSEKDLERLPGLFKEFEDGFAVPRLSGIIPAGNVFDTAGFLPVDDLGEQELDVFFGKERRHAEVENGRLLSFFCGQDRHVVLREKELLAGRPHAHIIQAGAGYAPDENMVSTTCFAFGVFNSHLSQGNTNFNTLLSVCNSAFNLGRESGQRIFAGINGRHYMLGVPSAFEMGLNHCRWIYKHGEYCLQVRSWTSKKKPLVHLDFRVLRGGSVDLLITHDLDPLNGWKVGPGSIPGEYVAAPRRGSMISGKFPKAQFRIIVNSVNTAYEACGNEALYTDRSSHGYSLFILRVKDTLSFCMSFVGEVSGQVNAIGVENADSQFFSDCTDARSAWQELSLNLSLKPDQEDISAIREILPWYGMNALVHFLTPYGLEQFSGAAWGTRDIAQGPFDLLLSMEKYEVARNVLCIIFSNQDSGGGWPQWWMFDSYREVRADSSHGDIFYWCIIALSNYIQVTGDLNILDEVLPYYHANGPAYAEKTSLSEHIDRLVRMITGSFIPGTALVPFGGGDWNDSLQPVSKELAGRMISAWTVEMNYQAFDQYGRVYELSGNTDKAGELREICRRIKSDFNKYLIRDGVVGGYGLLEKDSSISLLLHPSDDKTNVHYSILPMNRGIISGIFSREQAVFHQDLIEQKLKGPDGARLMDRPLKYKGGIQTFFQRAESSTFFGREIGLMYIHEHIRYAESLARTGRSEAFLLALRQANPVAYRDVVPCGDIRQSNCYYSSSDVAFKNRYEADQKYDEIRTGNIILRGGWRVYSSGPGIYIGLILTRLLGLRVEAGCIIIDPVIPHSLDGLSASILFMGHPATFIYSVKEACFSPRSISVNGKSMVFRYEDNKYRKGGAVISSVEFLSILNKHENTIEILL